MARSDLSTCPVDDGTNDVEDVFRSSLPSSIRYAVEDSVSQDMTLVASSVETFIDLSSWAGFDAVFTTIKVGSGRGIVAADEYGGVILDGIR